MAMIARLPKSKSFRRDDRKLIIPARFKEPESFKSFQAL
jgi:hypothetical protein